MDFIFELPKTKKGYTGILVVVDRFSKMAHFVPLNEDTSARQVARLFFQYIVKYHGLPKSIVSDRDGRFTGNFWRELFRE